MNKTSEKKKEKYYKKARKISPFHKNGIGRYLLLKKYICAVYNIQIHQTLKIRAQRQSILFVLFFLLILSTSENFIVFREKKNLN